STLHPPPPAAPRPLRIRGTSALLCLRSCPHRKLWPRERPDGIRPCTGPKRFGRAEGTSGGEDPMPSEDRWTRLVSPLMRHHGGTDWGTRFRAFVLVMRRSSRKGLVKEKAAAPF